MDPLPDWVNTGAMTAYRQISPEERAALHAFIERLSGLPHEQWTAAGANRLEHPEPLYFLVIGKSLRAYVRPGKEGQPEVFVLVRQELLDRYFHGGPLAGQRA